MSQPKRWYFKPWVDMWEKDDGQFVKYSDYAALAAENERLKQPWVKILTESETWKALSEVARLTADNERLKAEVEWLRKADRLVCWNPTTQQWEVRHESLQ